MKQKIFLFFKNLTEKETCGYLGDNNFTIFKTIKDEILLAYGTVTLDKHYYDIHFYDLELDKITTKISHAHEKEITNFRHNLDKIGKRDLLLTNCNNVNSLKGFDIEKKYCIIYIKNIFNSGIISSCFLMDEINSKNYIITVNSKTENLKIFNFNGKKLNEIDFVAKDKSLFVDSFYNYEIKKYYIIVGSQKKVVSYNFPDGSVFHKYIEDNSYDWHVNININIKDKEVKLMELDYLGNIRIWDFNKGELLKKIKLEEKVTALCLWSYKYLFVSTEDKKIKLLDLDLKSNYVIDNLEIKDNICILKKVESKKLGECLIFQVRNNNGIIIKKLKNVNSK